MQALPSLQLMGVKTQPVDVLQASVVHTVLSLQVMAVCVHPVEMLQPSAVQALLSLQLIDGCVQTPLVQTSFVQTLLSSQFAIVSVLEQVFVHPFALVTVTE